jgi:hypothetical protein
LSAGDLQVYLDRIAELGTILQRATPDVERIVEWLVRCAEEPATRWEGAYELALSAYDFPRDMDRLVAAEDEADLNIDGADGQQAEEEGEVIVDSYNENDAPIFVLLLTEGQKERLATALFNSSVISSAIRSGDDFLIRVVETWNPPKLTSFLLTQLSQMCDKAPREAEIIIEALSRISGDRSLAHLVRTYVENVPYEDLDETDNAEPNIELSEDAVIALQCRREMLREILSVAKEKMAASLATRD